jgi:preprotein translocase subunit YajC
MLFDDLPLILAQGGEPAPGGDSGTQQGTPSGQGGQATEGQDGSPQTGAPGQGGQGSGQGTGQGGGQQGFPMELIILLVLGVVVVLMLSSSRREKKRKQQMQDSLQKGAKITTVGGIIGTVVEVRDDELVVKVDENANTRLRFSRTAVASVQAPEQEEESSKE